MRSIRRLFPPLVALSLAAAAPVDAAKLYMFVTSAMGPGNLAAWPDAENHSGLVGGDTICKTLALEAGLANPTAYRAYLSSSTDDAYCRLHGLTGKKSANCTQPSLPTGAGPWWRTDGKPFGDDLPDLLPPDYAVILPPSVDQNGVMPPPPHEVWTGTSSAGSAEASTCINWTSPQGTDNGIYGHLFRTGYSWATGYSGGCLTQRRLYCFETGDGDPLPVYPANRPLAFLTNQYGYGDLSEWPQAGGQSGIAAGDEVCRVLADYAGLRDPDSFKAWLSDASTDAASRFVNHGPWARLDGMLVAESLDDLLDGSIAAPINVMETGDYGSAAVWTGTLVDGTACTETCDGWSSGLDTFQGRYGIAYDMLADWTAIFTHDCDFLTKRLYCLHDVPLLFFDDFESGALLAWSARLPAE